MNKSTQENQPAAVVTGASRGIGKAIAIKLAEEGCAVCGIDVERGPLMETCEQIRSTEGKGIGIDMDVSSVDSVINGMEEIADRLGPYQILVNNAGIHDDSVLWKQTDLQWEQVLKTNLTGCFYTIREAVPVLREQDWGRIINISSINGLRGKFGQANYSASKSGLIGLTKTCARELGRFNITVNAVAPGLTKTTMADTIPEAVCEKAREETVLGRLAEPEDVAGLVSFLAGPDACHITGEVIRVDGGQYI